MNYAIGRVARNTHELFVGPACGLGLIEEEVHTAYDGKGAVDEGGLGAEVGLVRVENVREDECCEDGYVSDASKAENRNSTYTTW